MKYMRKALWSATLAAASFGLVFGAMTALILLPIGYWFGHFELMAVLSVILGLVAALSTGLISYGSSLRPRSRFTRPDGEVLRPQEPAAEVVSMRPSRTGTIFPSTEFNCKFTAEHRQYEVQKISDEATELSERKAWEQMYFPQEVRTEISAAEFIAQTGAFPLPDRSHIHRNRVLASGQVDLGWSSGSIHDGIHKRPLWIETWADVGHVTNQTFFFSRIGLEDLTATEVRRKLRAAELIECVADAPCELLRIEDHRGNPMWSFNLCLALGDTIYVSRTAPYQAYPQSQSVCTHCQVCGAAQVQPFVAFGGRGVPHGSPGHEYAYGYQEILLCPSCGNGQLEVHSHDCWTHEEPWDMFWWYAIAEDDLQVLLAPKEQYCNIPLAAQCECAWHQAIRQQFLGLKPHDLCETDASRADRYYWLQAGFAASGGTPVIDLERGPQRSAGTARLP
jgi:hypothetical protein